MLTDAEVIEIAKEYYRKTGCSRVHMDRSRIVRNRVTVDVLAKPPRIEPWRDPMEGKLPGGGTIIKT